MAEVRRIGKYEILEEVGRGGFAVVYRARDVTLNRLVALKVLLPQLTTDPKFIQRFQQEAQTAAQLHHPHIVTIYEVGQERGIHYLAMTYLTGQTLDKRIAKGDLRPEQAVAIVEQLTGALDLIHSRGLVHRDIKPANIMIDEDGQATLLDFGIVRAAEGTRLTTTMAVLGTPEYMAPEQAEVDEAAGIDWRADIYALGVVAYEMLVGSPPFTGSSPTAVLYKHVYEAPPKPTELNPALAPGVEPVLLQALAKRREARFQRASDFASSLRAVMQHARRTAVSRQAPAPRTAKPAPKRISKAPSKFPTWLIGGGAALLVVVLLGLGLLLGMGGRFWPRTPTPTERVTEVPTLETVVVDVTDDVTDAPTSDEVTDAPTLDEVTVETPCVFNAAVVQGPELPWGSQVYAGDLLILNWQLRNTGGCVWETGTQLIPLTGDLLDVPVGVSYAMLQPGETMEVELALQAPETPGVHEMTMQLQAPDSSLFGPRIGFMVEVIPPDTLPDLMVTDIMVMDGDKLRCVYGNASTVGTPTEVLRIAFYVDGTKISESNVGSSIGGRASLAGGEESWLQTASLVLPSTFEVSCMVDSGDDIVEVDEGNNILTKVLSAP